MDTCRNCKNYAAGEGEHPSSQLLVKTILFPSGVTAPQSSGCSCDLAELQAMQVTNFRSAPWRLSKGNVAWDSTEGAGE